MHRKQREPQSPLAVMLAEIFAVCFGIFWTVMAGSMFPPMAIFGLLFIAIGAVNAYNTYKTIKSNAEKQQNDQEFCKNEKIPQVPLKKEELRCPYCGAPIHKSDSECEYCGSRL